MKIFKVLLVFIVILAGLFLLISAFIPGKWSTQKNIVIHKPLKVVMYEAKRLGGNFSIYPWQTLDSSTKITFSGVPGDVNYGYTWKSKDQAGRGSFKITKFDANSIYYETTFSNPYEATGSGYIKFEDLGDSTSAQFQISGHSPFHLRIFNLFMDGKLGPMYQQSLSQLKLYCENLENLPDIETIHVLGTEYIGIRGKTSINKIAHFLTKEYTQLSHHLTLEGKEMAGPPCALYFSWDTENHKTELMAAYPMKLGPSVELPKDTSGFLGYTIYVHPGYIVTDYYGDYKHIKSAHDALHAWLADRTKRLKYPIIEQYITDPIIEPDTTKWLTKVYYQF